jgi:prophage maintenance system killer protein
MDEPDRRELKPRRTRATEAFLPLNGLGLIPPDIEIVQTWSNFGASLVTEPELIDWLRQKTVNVQQ